MNGSGQDPGDTYCGYCDKALGIMKGDEFLDQVIECVSKKKGSTAWIYSEAIEGYLMAKPLPPPQCQWLLMSGLEGNTTVGRRGEALSAVSHRLLSVASA